MKKISLSTKLTRILKLRMSAIVLLGIMLFSLSGCLIGDDSYRVPAPSGSPSGGTAALQEQTASFSAVGDNLIHGGIYMQANRRAGGEGYDFSYVYDPVRDFFAGFDINLINQETLVTDELPPAHYPQFCTPEALAKEAYDVGWKVFTIGNNHVYDMGATGIAATRRFWDSMPDDVVVPGLYDTFEDSSVLYQEMNGIKIAYLSFAENTNGLPLPQGAEAQVILTAYTDVMERLVRHAKENADIVVVAVHWGVEYSFVPSDAQRSLAADLSAWGADLIIGGHPHVIQPAEWVENEADGRRTLVLYSMGNFLSAQAQAVNMIGLCLTLDLVRPVSEDGTEYLPVEIRNVAIRPTVNHYDAGFANVRVYMYSDYTAELAAQHGCAPNGEAFSREYIQRLMEKHIAPEFLKLD